MVERRQLWTGTRVTEVASDRVTVGGMMASAQLPAPVTGGWAS